jgi:hypothetical protein
MTTFSQAKKRAAALAGARKLPMAVIDCGHGDFADTFAVKNAFLAAREYPQDIKFVAIPNNWRDEDRAKITNGTFGT